jgi:hypothetical protein
MAKIKSNVPPPAPRPLASTPAVAQTPPTATTSAPATTASSGEFPTDPHQMDIICPFWNAMVAQGYVKMSPNGEIDLKAVPAAAREAINISHTMSLALVPLAELKANKPSDVFHNIMNTTFNVLELRAGGASHAADLGILRKGRFDADAFAKLVSHARDGRMTKDSLAEAVASDMKRDAGMGADAVKNGRRFAEAEAALLLTVFGQTDPSSGERFVTVDALRALFEDKQLPGPGNEKSGLIDMIKMQSSLHTKVDALLAADSLVSTATATGLAKGGADLTEGKKAEAADLKKGASTSAGKAANCPFMNGALPAPSQPDQTVNLHTTG